MHGVVFGIFWSAKVVVRIIFADYLVDADTCRQTDPIRPEDAPVKKVPFRLTPYQVQWLLIVGFMTVGYAMYLRYFAVEYSTVALACDAGLQTVLCKTRILATYLFKHSVFGVVALIIATLHIIRPSIVLLTGGLIAAGFGIVLYNIGLSGIAIGLLILGFARPAPATA